MLRNPVYNGWVRRHRRSPDEQLREAAWRDDPPVDDMLWARVQDVRADRDTGGGRSGYRYPHLLAGLVYCVCGTRIRAELRSHPRWPHRRYRHRDRCDPWPSSTRPAAVFDDPISAQVEQLRLGDALLVSLRRLAGSSAPTKGALDLRRRQVERELAALAHRHAKRELATDAYLAEHRRLAALLDEPDEPVAATPIVDPGVAIRWLRDIARMWRTMDDSGRAELAAAIYERITVTSEGIVEVALTEDAKRHGMALAMSERVILARPEGLEPPTL